MASSNPVVIDGGGGAVLYSPPSTLFLGTASEPVATVIVGNGDTAVTPAARTIRFTNASGVDNAAGNVSIIAPRSTGAAVPAQILFRVGDIAASSAVLQPIITAWTMRGNPTVANISELVSGQATARIIGGSTNGLAIRNSGNSRDNLAAADNGGTLALADGTRITNLQNIASTGELPSGGGIHAAIANATHGNTILLPDASVGAKVVIGYNDQTQWRSGVELPSSAAFPGTLALMKSGGVVTIGSNSTGTADNLTLAGSAYGAGVASLRFNGLTSGAGVGAGTITNAPAAGNPNFWLPVSIAGTVRYIPCW